MGTRSLVRFYSTEHGEDNEQEALLVTIYQQYDGYPDGVGLQLARWLERYTVGNGIPMDPPVPFANGPGCLAAQYIAEHKRQPGGFYIDNGKYDQEFNYEVRVSWNGGPVTITMKADSDYAPDLAEPMSPQEAIKAFTNWTYDYDEDE